MVNKIDEYDDSVVLESLKVLAKEAKEEKLVENDERIEEFYNAYEQIKKITSGQKVLVVRERTVPTTNSGFIAVKGDNIVIEDIDTFTGVLDTMTNLHICPGAKETVRLEVGYYGMLKQAEN